MKRKFTFLLAALMLLAFMTPSKVGWGQTRDSKTYTLTISASDFNTTSYAANNNEKTSNAIASDNSTYEVKWTSNQVMKNGDNMQWQKSKGFIYNSTDLGTISSVTVNSTAGSFTTYYGTSAQPTSGTTPSGGYFKTSVGSATGTTSSVVIVFTIVDGGSTLLENDLTLNETSKEFDLANGDGQTFQLTNSGDADGALSFASDNTSVATVSNAGLITAISEGAATITVTQAATSTYEGGTATCAVTVIDSRYSISDLTFTAACGGSGTADDGAEWTVTSDGTESSFDGTKGIHYGTGSAAVTYIQLSTSDINGSITKIIVNASTANGVSATVGVTVSGLGFGGDAQSLSNTATNYTFTGSAQGEIIVTVTKPSSSTGALYVKSVKVYYIPSTDPYITADNVDIEYDATGGNIAFTVNNEVTGGAISAATTDSWITLGSETTSPISFTCSANSETTARTATVTLTYTYNTNETVTKDVTITQAAAPVIYTTIPALFAAATSTETNVNVTFGNWVVSGVSGSNAFVTDNNGNGFIIYKSGHGFAVNDKLSGTVTGTPLKLYNGSAEFTNLTSTTEGLSVSHDGEITVITNKTIADLGGVNTGAVITLSNLTYDGTNLSDGTNTIKPYSSLYSEMSFTSGTVYNVTGVYQQFGSSTKEILPRSAADIVESTNPVINADNVNIAYDATSGEIAYTITNPDGTSTLGATTTADWISNIAVSADKVTFTTTANSGAEDRTATFTLTYTGAANKTVTVTQAHYVVDYATLPFNWAGGTSSDLAALAGVTTSGLGSDYAATNAPYRVKMDGVGDYIQVKTDVQPVKVIIGVKMLGGSTTSKIKVQESANGSDFTDVEELTISGAQNTELTLETSLSFAAASRYVKIIKSEHASGGNIGVGPIRIAKYASFDKVIAGYGTGSDKWYLIASPVVTAATAVTNMIADDNSDPNNCLYDLYYFDQTQNEEWRNYRANSFNLQPGQGYLYARKDGATLTFSGSYFGNGVVDLSYESTAALPGWNLIGNPFATAATLNMPFYKMNDNGDGFSTELEGSSNTIGIMEGVFVQAEATATTATFTAQTRGAKNAGIANANLSVADANGKVVDNAIVRFDNGKTLEKFTFRDNNTKVYFTQDRKDYAVVNAEAQGELPVNFKAATDGTYTINVETENLDVNYLHLIDNKTGMDIDLMASPTYTFEGKRTDYASRFRLVFNANSGNNEISDNFAFMSDGNLIVNGEGTLQMVDILGRIVFTSEVNSSRLTPNSSLTPGVYVLRLVNGNNVKTQKIVIK